MSFKYFYEQYAMIHESCIFKKQLINPFFSLLLNYYF